MTPGRTSWWPCDSAEHSRELTVELGQEFGAAGPLMLRVLKDLAQQQRDEGQVRTGFRSLARDLYDVDAERTREILEYAASIGAVDDLVIDPDGRRFTCRISGWAADQARGRAAIKKAGQREDQQGTTGTVVPIEGDSVPVGGDVSGFVPPTRPDQTIDNQGEEQPRACADASARETAGNGKDSLSVLASEIAGVLQRGVDSLTTGERCRPATPTAVLEVLVAHPCHPHTALAAAQDARGVAQSQNRAPNIVGLFAQKLRAVSVGVAA